ncbi:c-type cytochrome [Blattabacterium cuenoti]|uniref:c-type cytochrome n=1 Tax=Blattabacterium cuenoti TaxID=1653831 RepID=UPI001EE9D961|nr:c-type cytochrome [Blattabacterium cuenoti]
MKKILFLFLIIVPNLFYTIKSKDIIGDATNGKKLFKENCTACHSIELEKTMIGPALSGITDKRDRIWLHKWIKNNKLLRNSGDKDAISIYKEYRNIEMNSFPKLSEQDIDDILFFIKNPIQIQKNINNNKNEIINENDEEKNFLIRFVIFCISISLIITTWILYRIQILIKLINKEKKTFIFSKMDFLIKILHEKFFGNKKKRWYIFSCFLGFFILFNLYELWIFMIKIDVNKGYEPEQPIYFSHKIHSGINKIDCQYCHSSAKYGKISGIPSTNVCMNCHITIDKYQGDYIEKGKNRDYYNKEIQKIYYSIGWDPENRVYSKKNYPIKWIRIHNMPDFVYFDHSQHIITGKEQIKKSKNVNIVCNACHGEVEKMDKIRMSNDFTMEWCVTCHKNTEIDKNNQYYKNYFLNFCKNKEKKTTVDMIGGKECAKCHY